ncbi:MAG: hypothetical protein IMF10_04420 [Proteobacteria bacterium]|nr:hypothetical protein [Pseudomonadota bacterium]
MTITTYQVDKVLKAYSKQSKNKIRIEHPTPQEVSKGEKHTDVVTLSSKDNKVKVFDKISYNALDVILKGKK